MCVVKNALRNFSENTMRLNEHSVLGCDTCSLAGIHQHIEECASHISSTVTAVNFYPNTEQCCLHSHHRPDLKFTPSLYRKDLLVNGIVATVTSNT
jgi:hypothetical protein